MKVHNEAKSTALEFDLNIRILYPWGLLPEAHRGAAARGSQVSRAATDRFAGLLRLLLDASLARFRVACGGAVSQDYFALCWAHFWRASGVASLAQSGLFCCLCWTHSFFA